MVYTQNPLVKRLRGWFGLFLAICGISSRKIFQPNGLRDCRCTRAIKLWSLPRYDCAGFGGNVLQRAASKMLKRIREFAVLVARGGRLAEHFVEFRVTQSEGAGARRRLQLKRTVLLSHPFASARMDGARSMHGLAGRVCGQVLTASACAGPGGRRGRGGGRGRCGPSGVRLRLRRRRR